MKNKLLLEDILKSSKREYEEFHAKTKKDKLARNTSSKYWPKEWKEIFYKSYARFPEIKLPKPKINEKLFFEDVFKNRKSTRVFSEDPLNIEKISALLYFSCGINKESSNGQKRFYPSGGGRYPLEIYLISLNSELPKGVYHYYVKNNSLEKLWAFKKKDLKKLTNLKWVERAGCIIIMTAVFKRTIVKYGDGGYRHILSETGHVAQNLYLLASALSLSGSAAGGYRDNEVNSLLEVDGKEESVVYFFAVGERK